MSLSEGHFRQQHWEEDTPPGRADVNLHAMTAGVAMLSLYYWLIRLRYLASAKEASALPARLAIITDKGKGSKEQGNLVVKEAVAAIMALWQAPFRCLPICRLSQQSGLILLKCVKHVFCACVLEVCCRAEILLRVGPLQRLCIQACWRQMEQK